MAQLEKIGRVATTIKHDKNITMVIYHKTAVVEFDDKKITLKNDGYYTQTTKNRMNQASNEFNLGFYVYQREKVWYVDYKGITKKFVDGMTLKR